MFRKNLAGWLALLLGFSSILDGSPAGGQETAPGTGSSRSAPSSTLVQDVNGRTTESPMPQVAPRIPELALPEGPVDDSSTTVSPAQGGQAQQGPSLDAFAPGGGGFSPFLNPLVGHAPLRADYRATWLPAEPVTGQPTNLGYVQQDLSVAFPLWQCGTDEWSASVNVRSEIFHTQAILPDTLQPFPQDLWNIRFGTTYRHLFDNGWIAGGTVSFGSASDKPFHSIDELTAGVNAFLRVPHGEHDAWLFSLSYSPVSELPYPIPGVAYLWQPSENFRANIGLPFQVMWRPMDDLTLDLSYMLLTTVQARATYRLSHPLRVYVAYATETEAYLLADRVSSNDRFFNVDQRLTAGVQYSFSPKTSLDLSGGYIFDHHFFEGKNITNGTNFNRIDVGNAPYVSLQFRVRW